MSDDPIAGRKFVPGCAASPRLRPPGLSHFHSQPSPMTRTLSFVVVIFTKQATPVKAKAVSEGPSPETLAHSLAACPAPPPWPRPSCSCRRHSPPFLLPGSWGKNLGCWRQVNIPRGGEERERWRRRGESCRRISCSPAAVADAPRRAGQRLVLPKNADRSGRGPWARKRRGQKRDEIDFYST